MRFLKIFVLVLLVCGLTYCSGGDQPGSSDEPEIKKEDLNKKGPLGDPSNLTPPTPQPTPNPSVVPGVNPSPSPTAKPIVEPVTPTDFDGDGAEDSEDDDDDNDGIKDDVEIDVGMNPTSQDSDGDGFLDGKDNCPLVAQPTQADDDDDGVGTVCDNCPFVSNSDQKNSDGVGKGDVCEQQVVGKIECATHPGSSSPAIYNLDKKETWVFGYRDNILYLIHGSKVDHISLTLDGSIQDAQGNKIEQVSFYPTNGIQAFCDPIPVNNNNSISLIFEGQFAYKKNGGELITSKNHLMYVTSQDGWVSGRVKSLYSFSGKSLPRVSTGNGVELFSLSEQGQLIYATLDNHDGNKNWTLRSTIHGPNGSKFITRPSITHYNFGGLNKPNHLYIYSTLDDSEAVEVGMFPKEEDYYYQINKLNEKFDSSLTTYYNDQESTLFVAGRSAKNYNLAIQKKSLKNGIPTWEYVDMKTSINGSPELLPFEDDAHKKKVIMMSINTSMQLIATSLSQEKIVLCNQGFLQYDKAKESPVISQGSLYNSQVLFKYSNYQSNLKGIISAKRLLGNQWACENEKLNANVAGDNLQNF